MTKNEFDHIINTVVKNTKVECPDNFRVILWGKYKDWDSILFSKWIVEVLKKGGWDKHVNS